MDQCGALYGLYGDEVFKSGRFQNLFKIILSCHRHGKDRTRKTAQQHVSEIGARITDWCGSNL